MPFPQPGYTCRICGTPVTGKVDGEGFALGKYRFVTCTKHANTVRKTAAVTRNIATLGARMALATKAPKLLALLDQAYDLTYPQQEPVVVTVEEVRK